MDAAIQQAERSGDIVALSVALRRAGYAKTHPGQGCPHCGIPNTGWAAWPDNLPQEQWDTLKEIGMVYLCYGDFTKDIKGCDNKFVWKPVYINLVR